jgi:hypothetical protein
VRAITLGIDVQDDTVIPCQDVVITAKVDLHSNDIVPEDLNFTIVIEGGDNAYTCVFDIGATKLSECEGFEISYPGHNLIYYDTSTSLSGYGYGYDGTEYITTTTSFGYGYGYGYSYGYGYGYSYGYGYDDYSTSLKEDAEITFTIKWTAPSAEEETDYSVSLEAKIEGGGNGFAYTTLLSNQGSFTVSPEEEEAVYIPNTDRPGKKTEYGNMVIELTQSLSLDMRNRVRNTCNLMRGIIESAKESSVTTDISQFQEQIKNLGLENVGAVMTNVMEERQFMPSGLSSEVREKFKDKVFVDIANVIKNVKITTFIGKDGTSANLIEVSYTIDNGDFAIEIPKTVVATADEIQGNFEVLVNDPVLLFNDVRTAEFGIEAETNELEEINKEIEEISISKVEERQQSTTTPTPTEEGGREEAEQEPPEPTPPVSGEEEKGSLAWLWILLIVAIIAVVVLVIQRKTKKP